MLATDLICSIGVIWWHFDDSFPNFWRLTSIICPFVIFLGIDKGASIAWLPHTDILIEMIGDGFQQGSAISSCAHSIVTDVCF